MNGQFAAFAASFAAVATLVLAVHLAGFSRPARLRDEQEAREIASLAPGGFAATRIALDADGRGALLADASGRLLLIRENGAQFVARPVSRSALRAEGKRLFVQSDSASEIALTLGPDAALWTAS